MGTTLTGTTPQDTYDSLIKVTDNGPLSGTAKYLSDGLGNDSALALSTTSVGVSIASPATKLEVSDTFRVTTAGFKRYLDVSEGTVKIYASNTEPSIKFGDYNTGLDRVATIGFEGDYFGRGALAFTIKEQGNGTGAEAMRISPAGNVGIGTSSPTRTLDVVGSSSTEFGALRLYNSAGSAGTQNSVSILLQNRNSIANLPSVKLIGQESSNDSNLGEFIVQQSNDNSATLVEVFRTATAGAGGAPFLRMATGTGGIQFNGDTAAANALDDYEEGTWTPTFTDTLGNNVTASSTATYTKIGRQVTLTLVTAWSNKSAASSGSVVYMSGVPFNMNNKANGHITYYSGMNLATLGAFTIANAGTTLCYFPIQDNAVEASFLTFGETTNTSAFWFTLTYFV